MGFFGNHFGANWEKFPEIILFQTRNLEQLIVIWKKKRLNKDRLKLRYGNPQYDLWYQFSLGVRTLPVIGVNVPAITVKSVLLPR